MLEETEHTAPLSTHALGVSAQRAEMRAGRWGMFGTTRRPVSRQRRVTISAQAQLGERGGGLGVRMLALAVT